MSTRFFTNLGEHTLFKKFQGVFESNTDIERFDALVGYLRSSGYFALRPYLEKVPYIRILVGINVDAIMADYHRRGLLFLADPTKALAESIFRRRQERWEFLAHQLKKLEEEIEKRDLKEIPAPRLHTIAAALRAEISREIGLVHFSESTKTIPSSEFIIARQEWEV